MGVLRRSGAAAATLVAWPTLAQEPVEPRQPPGAAALDPITVEGERPALPTGAIGTTPPAYAGGQVATGGRVGVLGNRDLLDTPFNTRGYTERLIRDQQARNAADVLANDPSARPTLPRYGDAEQFLVRGFPLFGGEIAFDGLYGIASYVRTPVETLERVEIVKGPTTLLNGIPPVGGVGGTVNLVPKRAPDVPLLDLTGTYASAAQLGGHADLGRRFGREGRFGVRLNGAYRDGETPIKHQSDQSGVAALALDFRGERLRLTADAGYQRIKIDGVSRSADVLPGFAIPDAPDADVNFQQPWESYRAKHYHGLARAEYDLLDGLTAFAGYGQSRTDEVYFTGNATLTDGDGTFSSQPFWSIGQTDRGSGEAGLRGRVELGPVTQDLVLSGTRYWSEGRYPFEDVGDLVVSNIYDPVRVPKPSRAGLTYDAPKSDETQATSFVLADTVSILDGRVALVLGAREQRVEVDNFDAETGGVTSRYDERELTPALAAVVKPLPWLSLYGNLVENLAQGPTAPEGSANAGEVFPPTVSEQREVGVKADLGAFAVTLSLFEIKQPSAFTDPATEVFDVNGEQRSRGVELEAFGEPVAGFRVLGGVAFLDGELTETEGGANDGNTAVGVPDWQINLGAEWDLPFVPGLTLTGRTVHTSSQYYDQENTQQIPSWTRFDVGARYTLDIRGSPVTIRAAVENLTDDGHWQSTGRGLLTLGPPRTFLLSTSVRF